MLNNPSWYNILPEHLKPGEEVISNLENLRKNYGLSNDALAAGIEISSWAAVRSLELMLKRFRQMRPEKSEKELWEAVVLSWFEGAIAYIHHGKMPEHFQKTLDSLDETMNDMKSWNDVVKFILKMEEEDKHQDFSGIQNEIDKILYSY
jgi:hypothetical protein